MEITRNWNVEFFMSEGGIWLKRDISEKNSEEDNSPHFEPSNEDEY